MQAHDAAEAPGVSHAGALSALTALPPSYKRQAWLAVGALLGFVAVYFCLAGWFLFTAWRLSFGPGGGTDNFWNLVIAACAAFLAVFMIKSVFFIQRGRPEGLLELTAEREPALFCFLHELADKAGAPRPHKVFVSARVNAAVFYDLSLLNLLLPSRKNLEIGLGLVNTLTLGEMRAVLAHEFGHFAQRSMAVGRWVYVAHQIAANMVARRDKLDAFLNALSRFDFRVAWVGWLLQIVLWSIRSLVATVFQGVIVMQRALSREMEMQADLVAVSLTGSDALVHALLKLQAADDSWDRALGFAGAEKAKGRTPRDVFAMQRHVLSRMGEILQDPLYGNVPPLPQSEAQAHRVFKTDLAQPPRMWLSHPLNHEREANAKRVYVAATIDQRSAWDLFQDPQALREQITAEVIGKVEQPPVDTSVSLAAIDEAFDRPSLDGQYRGVYLGRSSVRWANKPSDLYTDEAVSVLDIEKLYPATLVHDIELMRQLERELGQLQALHDGALQATGAEIHYRGVTIARQQLPRQIEQVRGELHEVRERLQAHDRWCRSVHLQAAKELGQGWEEHVRGLLAVLHYADHTEANLADLHGLLGHTFRVATATGKVNDKKLQRLIDMGNVLQEALAKVYIQRRQMTLDAKLLTLLAVDSWSSYLGDLALPPADRSNIGEWLKVVDGWVSKTVNACGDLRRAALDRLLKTEAMLAGHVRMNVPVGPAPAPSVTPQDYELLLLDHERKPQDKLDWWSRFQTADGKVAAVARFAVAAAIVTAVLFTGGVVGTHNVMVYNGLARAVVVRIGGHVLTVGSRAASSLEVDPDLNLHVEARTTDGELIEAFDASRSERQIYNVGGASPLVVWTAVYGPASAQQPQQQLGAPRWFSAPADVLFADPPRSVSTKYGQSATRRVLQGVAGLGVKQQLDALTDYPDDKGRIATMHARWDGLDSPDLDQWLYLDSQKQPPGHALADRLAITPGNVLLRRLEQDLAASEAARSQVCEAHKAKARVEHESPDWAYMAVRCLPEGDAKRQAFLQGHARWPRHPWFTYATSYVQAEAAQWQQALINMADARSALPVMAESIAEDEARVARMLRGEHTNLQVQAAQSRAVQFYQKLESDQALNDQELGAESKAYAALAQASFAQGQGYVGADASTAARWLRLAAASDRAPADMVDAALKLADDSGMDAPAFWASVGLAIRTQRDLAPYERLMREAGTAGLRGSAHDAEQMWALLTSLPRLGPSALTDTTLAGLGPQARGLVYSAGVTALGPSAPRAWRDAAKRLLFASERPYFY